MQKIVNFFRGSARVEVSGGFPERFLNLCAQAGIPFWDVEWLEDGGVRLRVARREGRRAAQLGERAGCSVKPAGETGLGAFLGRFRRRYALLAGMAASLVAVCVLSQFVLWVEVTGNERVSSTQIMTELRRLGLRPGSYGPGLDEGELSRELLVRVKDLAWCTVNLHGTRAEVIVREAVVPPELSDESELGDVVARAGGIITHMEVLEGEPAVGEGATVLEGDVLIAGNVQNPAPLYSQVDPGRRVVRARGRVYARTWRTLKAQLPLTAQVKRYTGASQRRWAAHFFGRRVNFYANSGNFAGEYDKITEVWRWTLPSGQEMPLSLSRETCRAYETETVELRGEAARAMLEERLLAALGEEIGEGEILSTAFSAQTGGGMLTVTLRAECREEIGRFVPFSQ